MWHWRVISAVGLLVWGSVKLLAVVFTGETAHEDGGKLFCRVKADGFTRGLFAVVAVLFLAIAAFIILVRFGHF